MTKKLRDLDKFYTHPDIAKMFVERINDIVPLVSFDMVLEPSAGSGNILHYLPEGSIGLDLHPESPSVLQQDFFEYQSPFDPLYNNVKIACVGNPPFGKGYMNPLAKRFFNHAAEFSSLIAFIVPAKWHTSWKIHKQLNKNFGLYFSEVLPKYSFLFDGKPYNVNCCMQIWSREQLGTNIRILNKPPTSHPDFDLFLTCDKVPKTQMVRDQIANREYWDFGMKYWGKIGVCDIEDVPANTTTHFVFASKKPYVRMIFENIDWKRYIVNMGAPNIGGKSIVIEAYMRTKEEMNIRG